MNYSWIISSKEYLTIIDLILQQPLICLFEEQILAYLTLIFRCSFMSSDTDSVRHIAMLLQRRIVVRASYFSPSTISYIFTAPGNKNISPMVRGVLFMAVKYETAEMVIIPFILTMAAVQIKSECLRTYGSFLLKCNGLLARDLCFIIVYGNMFH
jgi:hypothetical protein